MLKMGYRQPVRPLGAIVREALATVAMECGPFTPKELADLERIASGEITVEESLQIENDRLEKLYYAHPEKFYKMPDFIKKRRKLAKIKQESPKKRRK